MDRLMWSVFVVCLYLKMSSGQDTTRDRGVALTLWPEYTTGAKIRTINRLPGYEAISRNNVRGIRFQNRDINFFSIDSDYRTNRIYLYDSFLHSIVIGVNFNTSMVISGDDKLVFNYMYRGAGGGKTQIAVDWISHNVYWTDPMYRLIMVAPAAPEQIPMDYRKSVVTEDLQEPTGIAVDPVNGYLYFSDIGDHPTIERTNMKGGDRTRIITSGLLDPRILEWDHWDKRLYWIDYTKETIQWVNIYSSNNISTHFTRALFNGSLFDLAVFKDIIYVTDINRDYGITTINKTTGFMIRNRFGFTGEKAQALTVFSIDAQPMVKDYCADLNCAHICVSKKNGAECICSDGYKLASDSRGCEEDTGAFHTAAVYSTNDSICLVDVRTLVNFHYVPVCIFYTSRALITSTTSTPDFNPTTTTQRPSVTNGTSSVTTPHVTPATTTLPPVPSKLNESISFLDVDARNRLIYFTTDKAIYRIPVTVLKGKSLQEQHLLDTLGVPSGLVYDWIDSNLYWSEADTGSILVYSPDKGREDIFLENEAKPKSLILLPHERRLMWIAGTSTTSSYAIRTVKLNGLGLTTVVKNLYNPKALTRDPYKPRILWLQSGNIKTASFDGKNHTTLHSARLSAYLLNVYHSFLIWTAKSDALQVSRVFVDDFSSNNIHDGEIEKSIINDLKFLDEKLQPDGPHACSFEACDQICLTLDSTRPGQLQKKCQCEVGYELFNETHCTSYPVNDNFILVGDTTLSEISQIPLNKTKVQAIQKPNDGVPTGVLFDRRVKEVIYGVKDDIFIKSISLDGSRMRTLGSIRERNSYPYRFALDETTGNLYYTTRGYMSIVAVRTPTDIHIKLVSATIPQSIHGDIVVHPGEGYMFWADISPSNIWRANMDGKAVLSIYSDEEKIRWPDGLAVDYVDNKLYFADEYYDTINRLDFGGENFRQLHFDRNAYILDIAIDGLYLYYTSRNRMYINRLMLANISGNPETIKEDIGMGRLEAIDVYNSTGNIQPKGTACVAKGGLGDCSTICYPAPAGGRTCGCIPGDILRDDKKTCASAKRCSLALLENADIVDPCPLYFGSQCHFICKDGFRNITTTSMVTCTTKGWDKTRLCLAHSCPMSVDNVIFKDGCSYKLGASCHYDCMPGYDKSSLEEAKCLETGKWDISSCIERKCVGAPANAVIREKCSFKTGESCSYECKTGYAKSEKSNARCLDSGKWEDNLCTGKPSGQKSESPTPRIVGGIFGALGAILLILVLVGLFFYRRRWQKQTSEPRAVYDGGPNIAIENPGYMSTGPRGPFGQTDPVGNGSNGISVNYGGTGMGIENPGYKTAEMKVPDDTLQPSEEPRYIVPNVSTIPQTKNGKVVDENPYANIKSEDTISMPEEQVDADDIVLTQDSWLKLQAKVSPDGIHSNT